MAFEIINLLVPRYLLSLSNDMFVCRGQGGRIKHQGSESLWFNQIFFMTPTSICRLRSASKNSCSQNFSFVEFKNVNTTNFYSQSMKIWKFLTLILLRPTVKPNGKNQFWAVHSSFYIEDPWQHASIISRSVACRCQSCVEKLFCAISK